VPSAGSTVWAGNAEEDPGAGGSPLGYRQNQPRTEAELERFLPDHSPDFSKTIAKPRRAATHGQRIFRAAARANMVIWAARAVVKDSVASLEAVAPGSLFASVASARRSQVDFGEATDSTGRPENQSRPVRDDTPVLGSHLHPGLSPRVHGAVPVKDTAGPSSSLEECPSGSATTTRPSP